MFKVVRVKEEKLLSAIVDDYEKQTEYIPNEWVYANKSFKYKIKSPLYVFDTKRHALNFKIGSTILDEYLFKQKEEYQIWECEIKPYKESMIKQTVPNGTVYAEQVKLLKRVM